MSHYAKGFETGLYWEEDYTPGGPFLMSRGNCRCDETCKVCADNKQEYEDWHEGFTAGRFFQSLQEN